MKNRFTIKDRHTLEQGTILQCLNDGWVRVLMENGQIRDYRPKELVGVIRVRESNRFLIDQNTTNDKGLAV